MVTHYHKVIKNRFSFKHFYNVNGHFLPEFIVDRCLSLTKASPDLTKKSNAFKRDFA